MKNLHVLMQEIIERLKAGSPISTTPQLNKILGKIAEKNDLIQWALHNEEKEDKKRGEWMQIDICWWDEHNKRLVLAGESEPCKKTLDYTLEDFEKLASVKSDIKLMVLWSDTQKNAIWGRLESYLSSFSQHVESEHYIYVQLSRKGEFEDAREFVSRRSGIHPDVLFTSLAAN